MMLKSILKNDKCILEKYYGLIINGRCGFIEYSKSSIVMNKIGVAKGLPIKGLYFKDNFWDGSDLFMCKPDEKGDKSMFRFFTKKVDHLMETEKIKNISIKKITDHTISVSLHSVELTKDKKREMFKLK